MSVAGGHQKLTVGERGQGKKCPPTMLFSHGMALSLLKTYFWSSTSTVSQGDSPGSSPLVTKGGHKTDTDIQKMAQSLSAKLARFGYRGRQEVSSPVYHV